MADLYTRKNYAVHQLAYLAGIIDGEGCVYIGNHSCCPKSGDKHYQTLLKVTSTDKRLIDWLIEIFGGLRGEYTPKQTPKNSRCAAFFWQCTGSRLTHICESILPYMVIKKEEIEIMLKMRSTYNGVTQKGKQGIQRNSPELLSLRQKYMDELRALHIRNYSNKK